ncbi:hypothetical protein HID58_089898 [Brassica napus]|uniref:Replication protein A 70 kDa DNA-binding subunit B/D first OB fold domain-containing protein n=1 Tax=Brassica napus TaxID=3708 RepID=A0ABQ7Y0D3_BRANA|nr:hypothetical protein HID58_089898 [Brassica napus]
MSSVTSIVDLKPFKTSWTIKVKVIRLWKQTTGGGGETIDMVLTTTHPYRISFLSKTCVLPSEQLPGDLCGFQPVKYNEVLDGSLNPDYLIDIIGHIVKVSHIEHVNVNGQETEKLCLELRNSDDERIPLVLWGNAACDVNYAIQVRSEYTTICVLRFGKINVWNGELCVSNAFNISDIVLDPAMTEVNNFLANLPEDDLPLAIVESQYEALVNGSSDGDASFRPTPRKTLAEVLQTKQIAQTDVLLHALNTVVGKTYLFKIGIERENLLNKHQSYPVLKLITDKNLFNRYQDIGCTNAAKDTNINNMDIHSDSADMSDSFAMRPAKRIRALNRDLGESNGQNSGSNCFSSVMIKKEKRLTLARSILIEEANFLMYR